ncbi:hypothetical protein Naga_100054g14 [Nannochloropsis gaditana]|uniref:Uncharacterized protein n=1 Tax=Nannochloropsis gaditana TaxID=72520 RepID=W7TZJ5_9STRA|nr:hypothetical protein Naga_100054g14 [Nannochloropsis gaditana]
MKCIKLITSPGTALERSTSERRGLWLLLRPLACVFLGSWIGSIRIIPGRGVPGDQLDFEYHRNLINEALIEEQ